MHSLKDLEIVDGEPVAASLIPRAVTAGELRFDDGATQTFDVNGDTSYVEADGRPTQGRWYVDDDGRFCSFWPPTYRACYGLVWIVEDDQIVGLSFTELAGGARFDGRYKTPAHGVDSSALPAVGEREHVTGSSSPKLTLVEYGDFGCPYCFQASRPVKSLLDRFDGLRLVWRHFPVPALHPRADLAAELSELAGLHGKFWDAHSLLLTARGRFSHDELLSVAGRLQLDPAETGAALRDRTFRERVLADVEGARSVGVHATPTFFVDGERLDRPWRELPQIVRARLAPA